MENKETQYFIADIDTLIPYARNARTHSESQIAQIAASIKEFGFLSPIIIAEDNTILCGHGRFYGAQKLGLKKIPCIKESHLTETQRRAYILADNKLSLNAGWDDEMLAVELSELQAEDFDLELTGFDEKELADLFASDEDAKQDDFDVDAELEKPCKSKTGDVWHLGRHIVICGDSTLPETYTALLGDTKVNLVCTDPPYLVNLESTSGKIKNDDLDDEKGYEFLKSAFERFKDSMAKDASIYVFYATSKALVFHDAYEDAGFKVGAGLVWKKDRLVLTRTDWKYIHEPIIWGWRKDGKHIWYGDQKQKTVFEFDRIKNSKEDGCGHPSSKPVPLIAYLIQQCTQSNGLVLDGFLGSASTLIACEQLNRICFGVELEPKFVDVAVERYLKLHDGNSDDVYLIRDGQRIEYKDVEVVSNE
jgi:DNA modification methylase